jgi:glycosyltransferase involved in cell wall biosynthesis
LFNIMQNTEQGTFEILLASRLVFVHNLYSEAERFLADPESAEQRQREQRYYAALDRTVPIVANSRLVRDALLRLYALDPERVVVHYPGFDSSRFSAGRRVPLRAIARRRIGVDAGAPLIGFVTSGALHKRGLDIFLAAAARIAAKKPAARFLIVGSKQLPDWARRHELVVSGKAVYRPKGGRPELWMAALDLFLYAARFEEFGIVVSEAQALGVPVVTSRRVGATECMPVEYGPWLLDEPDGTALAGRALDLLDSPLAQQQLAAAGLRSVAGNDRQRYVADTVARVIELMPAR